MDRGAWLQSHKTEHAHTQIYTRCIYTTVISASKYLNSDCYQLVVCVYEKQNITHKHPGYNSVRYEFKGKTFAS